MRDVCLHVEGKAEILALLEECASEALDWVAEIGIDSYEGHIPGSWDEADFRYIAQDMYDRIQRRLMVSP